MQRTMDDRSRPATPLVYRFFRDRSGQSETLGTVLLLGIAIVGTGAIVTFGSTALEDTKQSSQIQRAEHAFTLFDSRAAMVALGESERQSVDLGGSNGADYEIRENDGRMRVVHYNHSGKGNAETIYNETLGALVYENGDTEITYQGGGVWRTEDNYTEMVSPPEFHYRASTLTLPVIRVQGNDTATGSTTASIASVEQARRVYPNATNDSTADDPSGVGAPYNASGDADDEPSAPYANPVTNGTVWVYVQSDFYKGWAEFFRTRSDGKVQVWDSNQTVGMELVSGGKVGEFQMPDIGNSVSVTGMGDSHPIDNFTLQLTPNAIDAAGFNKLDWSMYAEEGPRQWEIHLDDGEKVDDAGDAPGEADVYVYYSDDGGTTYQAWKAEDEELIEYTDYDGDGDEESVLTLNLTSENLNLTYVGSLQNKDTAYFDPSGGTVSPVKWDQHNGSVAWEPIWFNSSDPSTTSINNTTNHYLSQFSNSFELTTAKSNNGNGAASDPNDPDESRGVLEYDGAGQIFITFLHVTENEVRVEL